MESYSDVFAEAIRPDGFKPTAIIILHPIEYLQCIVITILLGC